MGVKPPSPSGLHFESGGGFEAVGPAGPPDNLSPAGTIARGEKWQKKSTSACDLGPLGKNGRRWCCGRDQLFMRFLTGDFMCQPLLTDKSPVTGKKRKK